MILKSLEELNPELSFKGPKIVRIRAIKDWKSRFEEQYMMIKITPWDNILEEKKNDAIWTCASKVIRVCMGNREMLFFMQRWQEIYYMGHEIIHYISAHVV